MKNLVLLTYLILIFTPARAQMDMKGFDLGEYSVGFRHASLTDYSRSFGDGPRPIQMFVWYPAKGGITNPMKFADYISISNPSGRGELLNEEHVDSLIRAEVLRMKEGKNIDVDFSLYKSLQTISEFNAPELTASFPLIMFNPGGNTPGYLHSILCEYLASHGYVVVAFPSLGNKENERWPFDQTGLGLQIDDMAFLVNHVSSSFQNVNIDKTALVSWSVGGVSQALYAMKNQNVNLFISLDSGIGREYGIEMLEENPLFNYDKFKIPYLHLTGLQPEMYKVERSMQFYDSIASTVKHSLELEPFAHQHFASQIGIVPWAASKEKNYDIIDGYIGMCKMVRTFANIYLKDDVEAETEWQTLLKK